MDTQVEIKSKAVALKEKLTAHIEELARLTDSARLSDAMVEYLEMAARFHQYSTCNIWLILMQRPDATYVAGFHKWKQMGRWVKKGEKGIPILAPVLNKSINKEGQEVQMLAGFITVHVFDIAQTDGKPLPEPPDWTSPQMDGLLQERLFKFTAERGIKVKVQCLPNHIQGASLGGMILLSPGAGTMVLVHEIAHELLHQCEDAPKEKQIRELEAEGITYVVGKHFEMDGLTSPTYIALHGATADLIIASLERIRSTAAELITGLETMAKD